jgi:glycosyltransferase involved in cell wall biosynthesis
MWSIRGRLLRLPRLGRRYRQRRGYLSALRYVARRSVAVWAPSAFTRLQVVEQFGVPCAVMPYCYDSDRFVADGPLSGAAATLLSVSRLEEYKNHSAVVRAAAAFDPPRPVQLIGLGPERASLEHLARSLDVPLTISANLSAAELVHAYRTAGVVVCPSTFEGMGLTPIEAAACGARVVASDIPPHREFLGDRVEFFLPRDDATLIAAIRRAEGLPPKPGPFAGITIGAAAARFLEALMPLLGR